MTSHDTPFRHPHAREASVDEQLPVAALLTWRLESAEGLD